MTAADAERSVGVAEDSHVVLDLAAEADVDGQPSLLVLRLHVRVLGGQRVLHLQAGRHAGYLGVARVGQHLGQLHQEGGLGGGEGNRRGSSR